jgi:prepilin-type processing-associated H-X9-DG protein
MIEFICSCGKELQAEEEHAGRLTRCPQCGRELPIPGREGAIRSEPAQDHARSRSTDVQQEPERSRFDTPDTSDTRMRPQTSGKATAALILGICSLGCNFLTGIPAVILGLLALSDINKSQGRLSGKALALAGMLVSVLSFVCLGPVFGIGGYLAVGRVRTAAAKASSQNNLKQLGIAMNYYHDTNGYYPPAQGYSPMFGFNPGGGPGAAPPKVSWRVLLLPYLEEGNLYNQYNFNEPWDGPNNSKLLTKMPKVYELPGDNPAPPGYTYYQVFVSSPSSSPQAMFCTDPNVRVRIMEVTDGTSNTLLIVEGVTAVPWTKPDDIPFDYNGPVPQLGTHYNGGCNACFADGSVRFLSPSLSNTTLRSLITRNGGEMIGADF